MLKLKELLSQIFRVKSKDSAMAGLVEHGVVIDVWNRSLQFAIKATDNMVDAKGGLVIGVLHHVYFTIKRPLVAELNEKFSL